MPGVRKLAMDWAKTTMVSGGPVNGRSARKDCYRQARCGLQAEGQLGGGRGLPPTVTRAGTNLSGGTVGMSGRAVVLLWAASLRSARPASRAPAASLRDRLRRPVTRSAPSYDRQLRG
jgi:hypothetical protein